MIVVEDGVFDRGQASNGIKLWDMQAKYADVIPSQQVIEQMDRMWPNYRRLEKCEAGEVEYAVCASQCRKRRYCYR